MRKALLLAVCLCVSLSACGEKKQAPRKAGEEKPAAAASEIRLLGMQPSGILTSFPDRLSFAVGAPVFTDGTGTMSRELSRQCVKITPDAPGTVAWDSDHTFNYTFEPGALLPGTKYEVTLQCVPSDEGKPPAVRDGTRRHTFTTPAFGVTSVVLVNGIKGRAEIRIQLSMPGLVEGADRYFFVSDDRGNKVKIESIEKGHAQDALALSIRAGGVRSFKLIAAKGYPSADGKQRLSQDASFELKLMDREIKISNVSAAESEDGFYVDIHCVVPGSKTCTLDPEQARKYMKLSPEIATRTALIGNGIRLAGPFVAERTYTVRMLSGITTREGGVLTTDEVSQVKIPRPEPRLKFAVKGHYLGRKGGAKVPLQLRLADEIVVRVDRIPQENIGFQNAFNRYSFNTYDTSGKHEPVERGRKISVGAGKRGRLFWLDLADVMNTREPGVYNISATIVEKKNKKPGARSESEGEGEGEGEGDESGYEGGYYDGRQRQTADSVRLVVSDLAVVAKRSGGRVFVWVLGAGSGMPVGDAGVEVISQNNVRLGGCLTDAAGYCSFDFPAIRDRKAAVLVAKKDNDWTFIDVDATTINMEPYDVSGATVSGAPYMATLYPERDIYRPGETVQFNAVVRQKTSYAGAALPVSVKVTNPRGKEIVTLQGRTDYAGMAAFTFKTEAGSATGKYQFQLYAGEQELSAMSIFVETFVPERLDVRLHASRGDYTPGQDIKVELRADYLFGVPASNDSYKVSCSAEETAFNPKEFPGYRFGVLRDKNDRIPRADGEVKSGTLDEKGFAETACVLPGDVEFKNKVEVSILGQVSEEGGGRATYAAAKVALHPFPFYIGLKPGTAKVEPGRPVSIKGVVTGIDGALRRDAGSLVLNVYQLQSDYSHIYNPDTGRFEWGYSVQKLPWLTGQDVQVRDGRFDIKFTPEQYYRDFLVEVTDPAGNSVTEVKIAGWGWWWETERPDSPEVLKIQLSKGTADYGEQVTASVLLPFEGRLLWTAEIDSVIGSQWQDAKGETASWTFAAPRGRSSVYVTALLIRVTDNYLVRRAYGIQRVMINPSEHRMDLKAEAPERMKSGEKLKVVLNGNKKFKGTVAIVDEGILNLTSFKTPDIYGAIFRQMALEVDTAETLGWIVPKGAETPGGSENALMKDPSFVRLVSYWSGLVESDPQGRLEVSFVVPPYNGRLRVMYAAADENRLGWGEKKVTVANAVVVSPTIPRFAFANDDFSFPISLKNTTDSEKAVSLSVAAEGAGLSDVPASVTVPARGSKVIRVPVKAGEKAGAIRITITTSAAGEKFDDTFTIPLHPDRPHVTEGKLEKIQPGSIDITRLLDGWENYALSTRIMLSPIPGIARLSHLKYLLHYPYGCVEQTSSSLLPLLRVSQLMPLVDTDFDMARLQNFVQSGIARLITMQTPSGGFGYWPGDEEPNPWASGYAIFVLLEAQAAGYTVPQSVIDLGLSYLSRKPGQRALFDWFVLAKGGKLGRHEIERLGKLGDDNRLTSEELMFQAAALSAAGKTWGAEKALDASAKETARRSAEKSGAEFYSPLREAALRLYVAETMRPGSAKNEQAALDLVQGLKMESRWYSTQELGWSVLALGTRVMNVKAARSYEAALTAGGKPVKAEKTPFGMAWTVKEGKRPLKIDVKADGDVYLFVENDGYKSSVKDFKPVSEGIAVKRQFLDIKGATLSSFKVRDIAVMEVVLEKLVQNSTIENLAVEVRVPAGFEIENPRMTKTLKLAWTEQPKDLWVTEYVDVRDDAVFLFGKLDAKTRRIFIPVRVVTPGKFFLPPVTVSAMYKPEIRANTDAGRLEVTLPQE